MVEFGWATSEFAEAAELARNVSFGRELDRSSSLTTILGGRSTDPVNESTDEEELEDFGAVNESAEREAGVPRSRSSVDRDEALMVGMLDSLSFARF